MEDTETPCVLQQYSIIIICIGNCEIHKKIHYSQWLYPIVVDRPALEPLLDVMVGEMLHISIGI